MSSMSNMSGTPGSNKSPKAIIVVALLLIGAGVISLFYSQGTGLKGQLLGQNTGEITLDELIEDSGPLPDLQADLSLVSTLKAGEDLNLRATIKNLGPGSVDGKTPFKYSIAVNGKEVFSNTDSYTSMAAGDSFSFDYPISKEINQYPDKGTVTFTVDTENSIKEADENNNRKEISYSY